MNEISSHEFILGNETESNQVRLHVFENPQSLALAAAQFILADIKTHRSKNRYRLALSGGSTPRLLYASLASIPESASLLGDKAEFFFSDERAVGPDDDDSNFGSAHRGLFEPLSISERIIHRMKGEATDLLAEAERYQRLITGDSDKSDTIPSLDLTILGMGADGHTASLFPEHDFGSDGKALIIAPWVDSKSSFRLSFSLTLINASAQVLFLVTGSDKAGVLADILSGKDSLGFPASKVRANSTLWMIDKSAATELILKDFRLVES